MADVGDDFGAPMTAAAQPGAGYVWPAVVVRSLVKAFGPRVAVVAAVVGIVAGPV